MPEIYWVSVPFLKGLALKLKRKKKESFLLNSFSWHLPAAEPTFSTSHLLHTSPHALPAPAYSLVTIISSHILDLLCQMKEG